MKKEIFILALIVIFYLNHASAYSKEIPEAHDQITYHLAPHPGLIADAVITITPDKDYDLHIPSLNYREISGEILKTEKIDFLDGPIIHRAGVMIAPIHSGKSIKIFLKKYEDRIGYYLVGIFPDDFPTEPK